MTWVKVCGMRTVSDVDAAATAGADAIGLVLIEESPRSVTVEQAATLAAHSPLPAIILTRDLSPDVVARLIDDVRRLGNATLRPRCRCSCDGDCCRRQDGVVSASG